MPRRARAQAQAASRVGAEAGALWGLRLSGERLGTPRPPPHTFNDDNATKTFI